jgi:hypothetical protein
MDCPVCLDRYSSSSPGSNARVLPCGHTVCRACTELLETEAAPCVGAAYPRT